MGVVYRARDTRPGRDVAIKVSSERFTERLEREARAVAALNSLAPDGVVSADLRQHVKCREADDDREAECDVDEGH
jgi:serine/threonine protein kinase